MKADDIKELSRFLQFRQMSPLQNAVTYGEAGEMYFIILKGACQVWIPNP